jgi:hypothetical protein
MGNPTLQRGYPTYVSTVESARKRPADRRWNMEKQTQQNPPKQQAGKPSQPNPMSGKPAQSTQQGSGQHAQTGTGTNKK